MSKLGYYGSYDDSTFGTILNANIIGGSDFQGYVTLNPPIKTVYVWATSANTFTVRVTYKN